MLKKIAVAIAGSMVVLSVFAGDPSSIVKSIDLNDGTTVHIFKDGKMAMENEFGNVISMREGHVMTTKNGQKIVMKGNEMERLHLEFLSKYQY
jgi:hypothetical protein